MLKLSLSMALIIFSCFASSALLAMAMARVPVLASGGRFEVVCGKGVREGEGEGRDGREGTEKGGGGCRFAGPALPSSALQQYSTTRQGIHVGTRRLTTFQAGEGRWPWRRNGRNASADAGEPRAKDEGAHTWCASGWGEGDLSGRWSASFLPAQVTGAVLPCDAIHGTLRVIVSCPFAVPSLLLRDRCRGEGRKGSEQDGELVVGLFPPNQIPHTKICHREHATQPT